jgi:Predicted transcriptional regulators
MGVRRLRLERGWSQEQLALLCGLSTRTIQRIENGQTPALETLNSLAAVFNVSVQELETKESEMEQMERVEDKGATPAEEYESAKQAFYRHLLRYLLIIAMLFVINWLTGPGYLWAKWPALGWGIGILSHARKVFWSGNLQRVA